MNNIIKYLFLIYILSFSISAEGQANYKKGYIITNNDDTIHGKINDKGGYQNIKVCLFKNDKNSKVIKYYPQDIKAYRMIGDKYYLSRQVINKEKSTPIFVEVLIEGKVNLYHYEKGKKTRFYIEKPNSDQMIGLTNEKLSELYQPLTETPVSYSKNYLMTNRAYLDTLSSVFRDDQKIQKKLHTTPYYRKSLMNITKKYIKNVCNGEDCLTYEKDITKNNLRIGIFTGMQISQVSCISSDLQNNIVSSKNVISNPIGAFLNIPISIIDERLSFQLEVIDHNINKRLDFTIDGDNSSVEVGSKAYSFPLSVKYEITGNRLSPSVSVGKVTNFIMLNNWIHREQEGGGGWFGEVGLDYKVYKKMSVFVNLRAESITHFLRAKDYYSYSENGDQVELFLKDTKMARAKPSYATLYFGIRF